MAKILNTPNGRQELPIIKQPGRRVLLIVGDRIDTVIGSSGYLYLCREDGAELRKLVWRDMILPEQLFALRVSVGEFLPDELLLPIPVTPDEAAVYREACRLAAIVREAQGIWMTISLHERVGPAQPPADSVTSYVDIGSVWAEKAADLEGTPEADLAAVLATRNGIESGCERAEAFYSPLLKARVMGERRAVTHASHPTEQ
ncbi:hypothetical protein [Paraburkholderia acidipaludis]|uniref:hypothetical protein n=1 Tax=Paraburkholderia acidipaludis TaxID=660537 RepID=UPI00048575A1|nr:hypothetical protein [Paraburkholderia acidipaludis]